MNNEVTEVTNEEPKQSKISSVFDYLEVLVLAVCVVLLLFSFVFRVCTVDGPSMEHTLVEGETLIISNLFYTPQCGDIVVFHQTSETNDGYNKPLIKRVIATEGQWIKIIYGSQNSMSVYVSDDDLIDESDLLEETYANLEDGSSAYYSNIEAILVPKGCIFAMGDHRYHSADSRDAKIGFVDTRRILGKVLLRITPFSKFGVVN